MESQRITVIQFSTEGVENIREKGLKLIEDSLKGNPDFIVLPELFTTKYFPQYRNDDSFKLAEEIPGPTTEGILNIIKGKKATVIASIYEKGEDGKYYCSAAVLNGEKGYLGKYRKLHIPTPQGIHEDYFFTPGNLGHVTFDTPKARIAVMLCYDRHFSESSRIYGLMDIDILFVCSATPVGAKKVWQAELCTHAYLNGYYVACANRSGKEDNIQFLGTSLLCNYKGELIVKADEDGDRIITAEIDINAAREYRKNLSFYRDRRPEIYSDILKPKG